MTDDTNKKAGAKSGAEVIADLIEAADSSFIQNSEAPPPPVGDGSDFLPGDDDVELPPQDLPLAEFRDIPDAVLEKCAAQPQNDTGNGQRLLAHFGEELLHVRENGWHSWKETHWHRLGGDEIAVRCAQRTAARIAAEADYMVATPGEARAIERGEEAAGELTELKKRESDWNKADQKNARRLEHAIEIMQEARDNLSKRQITRRKFSISSGNASKIQGMLGQALPHRTVAPEELDADPYLFNTDSGTLVFTVDEIDDPECPDPEAVRKIKVCRVDHRAHWRADLMSKAAPVHYDPAATCPRFDAFMLKFQPVEAIRRFLQIYFGYGLLGAAGEQCLVFLHGLGANGKSTFVEIICRIMGDYAQTLPFESLAGENGRRGDQATPDLACLPAVRLVRASEPERNIKFKEALLKSLTGGEPMRVRHLNKGFFSFRPVFKMVLSGNQKPEIGGVDHGIWRRMKLVPWAVTIGDDERRPIEDVLAEFWDERSGILNWLVEGTRLYLTEGLATPKEIVEATALYRADMDPLGAFIRACVEIKPAKATEADIEFSVTAREMYEAFTAWCEANSVKPWTEKTFGITMPQKGIVKTDERIRRYMNVRLHDVPELTRGRHDDEPPPHGGDEIPH